MSLRLAVLVSGSGSNLQSIIDKCEAGVLDAQVVLVLSNKAGAYGLERAVRHGIPTMTLDHKAFDSREAFDRAMVDAIRASGADTIILAGFMRLLTPVFLEAFPGRVLNIHPALLPSFAGVHGQADAANYGVKLSGATVHFVTLEMDSGPVIIQAAVPVTPGEGGDTLGKRILAFEHRIFPQAIQWLSQGRLRIDGRHVLLAGPAGPPAELHGPGLVNPPLEEGF